MHWVYLKWKIWRLAGSMSQCWGNSIWSLALSLMCRRWCFRPSKDSTRFNAKWVSLSQYHVVILIRGWVERCVSDVSLIYLYVDWLIFNCTKEGGVGRVEQNEPLLVMEGLRCCPILCKLYVLLFQQIVLIPLIFHFPPFADCRKRMKVARGVFLQHCVFYSFSKCFNSDTMNLVVKKDWSSRENNVSLAIFVCSLAVFQHELETNIIARLCEFFNYATRLILVPRVLYTIWLDTSHSCMERTVKSPSWYATLNAWILSQAIAHTMFIHTPFK